MARMKAMRKFLSRSVLVVAALAAWTWIAGAQERDRSKIPDKYKWNLSDLYSSEAAWRSAKDALANRVSEISPFARRLTSSASTLADALEKMSAIDKELSRLFVYASLLGDQDTRDSSHQGMKQEMSELAAKFSAAEAFVEPEILKADRATLDRYVAAEPRLKVYRF